MIQGPFLRSDEFHRFIKRRRFALGVAWTLFSAGWARAIGAEVGRQAQDFSLPLLNSNGESEGSIFRLAQLKQKWIYLDFWASWCGPCQLSFPWMKRIDQQYREAGLQIVAVCLDQDVQRGRQFLARERVEFPVPWDPRAQVAALYKLTVMPTSYLINPQGQIVSVHSGFNTASSQRIEASLKRVLL